MTDPVAPSEPTEHYIPVTIAMSEDMAMAAEEVIARWRVRFGPRFDICSAPSRLWREIYDAIILKSSEEYKARPIKLNVWAFVPASDARLMPADPTLTDVHIGISGSWRYAHWSRKEGATLVDFWTPIWEKALAECELTFLPDN